ncbi:MAG: amino acid permease, partial [Gemmatimonadota bacterium]|nr:amino acid permease [Gemmatimonadota bacterium]
GVVLVAGAVMVSTFGTLNGSVMTGGRILFAMANDGLLFRPIGRVHPRFQTPSVAIALEAVLGVVFVLAGSFESLADTFVTAIVPFYALAVAAIYPLRRKPDYHPIFRAVGYPIVPMVFVLATVFLLGSAILDSTSRIPTLAVLGVIMAGIPVYFFVARDEAHR